ncbi:MAG: hypothetical protein NTU53_21225 [Planctomycetota bacterium]|nr:hypothetical protein [Planctomycetota bacterium]
MNSSASNYCISAQALVAAADLANRQAEETTKAEAMAGGAKRSWKSTVRGEAVLHLKAK